MGMSAGGADPTGTGFNQGTNGRNSLSNFNCPDANFPLVGFDAGVQFCLPTPVSAGFNAATYSPYPLGSVSTASPAECNDLQWDGGSWGPSSINLAGGSGCITGVLPAANMAAVNLAGGSSSVTGTLPVANGGTNLSSVGASGTFLRSDGGTDGWLIIQSSDLTSALASPPVLGLSTPNEIIASTIVMDGGTSGFTSCFDSLGPIYDSCNGGAAMTISTWVTVDAWTPSSWNHSGLIDDTFAATDYSALSGTALSGNYQDCDLRVRGMIAIDGGIGLTTPGTTSYVGTQSLTCVSADSQTGCASYIGNAGCVRGTWNSQFSFQAIVTTGSGCITPFTDAGPCVLVQAAVDAGVYVASSRNDRIGVK